MKKPIHNKVDKYNFTDVVLGARLSGETLVITPEYIATIPPEVNSFRVVVKNTPENEESTKWDDILTKDGLKEVTNNNLPCFEDGIAFTHFSHFNTGKLFTDRKANREILKPCIITNKERESWANCAKEILDELPDLLPDEVKEFKFGKVLLFKFITEDMELYIFTTSTKGIIEVVINGKSIMETEFWKSFDPYIPQK